MSILSDFELLKFDSCYSPNFALSNFDTTATKIMIDCEHCEYAQFESWLKDWKDTGVTVRQIQLEIHGSDLPGVVDLFTAFQKAGYVMFHKEANYINQSKAIEAAFLLLSNDFQQ